MPSFPQVAVRRCVATLAAGLCAAVGLAAPARAEPEKALLAAARAQQQPLLATLGQLCNIESGSRDLAGLNRVATLLAQRLRGLGASVETIAARGDDGQPHGAMVKGVLRGRGSRSILLLAHMDTVYARGDLAHQPFVVRGDRAYGLGVADDRQGLAVILHALAVIKAAGIDSYGRITVLFNADEEIGSGGSHGLITRLASEADAVMSFEGASAKSDALALSTAGIGSVKLTVHGRAAHAGGAPGAGVNALVELSHQILALNDLSDPARGVKLNWTLASAGTVRNMIPPQATAEADVRVLDPADYDALEKTLHERVQSVAVPGATVEVALARGRPPLKATPVAARFAAHAQAIYAELGATLGVEAEPGGGGTDAAYAGLEAHGPVVERFGLPGAGAHSQDAEYVLVGSIVPRLYLVARMVEDVANDRWNPNRE
ncbi:MAG: M20/M25/M40 family metallo-hydrolase [Pelomonas sp.]|nr:M20/M25/M40 family metallo-hydrolase [Roseateles sp.]